MQHPQRHSSAEETPRGVGRPAQELHSGRRCGRCFFDVNTVEIDGRVRLHFYEAFRHFSLAPHVLLPMPRPPLASFAIKK
mgnify:CR=1 FL=1